MPNGTDRIVVMGVSGAGKSTVGSALAAEIGGSFIDADDLHSAEARAKMASGTPLTDVDREPWLRRVGSSLVGTGSPATPTVVACSALKRAYRDLIREAAGTNVQFLLLETGAGELRQRLNDRADHFMPASLLDSQLATLQPLEEDEAGITIDASASIAAIVAQIRGHQRSSRDESTQSAAMPL